MSFRLKERANLGEHLQLIRRCPPNKVGHATTNLSMKNIFPQARFRVWGVLRKPFSSLGYDSSLTFSSLRPYENGIFLL